MKTVLLTLFTFLLFSLQALAFEAGDIAYSKVHQARVEILGPGQEDGYYHVQLLDGDRAGTSFEMYAGDNLEPISPPGAPVVATAGAMAVSSADGAEDAQIAASVPLVTPEAIQACAANVSRQAGMDYDYAQRLCAWDSSQLMQSCVINGYQYHTDDTTQLVRFCYESQRPQLEQERAQLAAIRQQKIATLITARHAQEIERQNQIRYEQQRQQQLIAQQRLQQQAQQAQQLREIQDQQRAQESASQIEARAEQAKADEFRREQSQLRPATPKPVSQSVVQPVVVVKQAPVKQAPIKPVASATPKAPVVKQAPISNTSGSTDGTPKKKPTDGGGVIMDLPIDNQ